MTDKDNPRQKKYIEILVKLRERVAAHADSPIPFTKLYDCSCGAELPCPDKAVFSEALEVLEELQRIAKDRYLFSASLMAEQYADQVEQKYKSEIAELKQRLETATSIKSTYTPAVCDDVSGECECHDDHLV